MKSVKSSKSIKTVKSKIDIDELNKVTEELTKHQVVKSKTNGMKDITKINQDPETYANSVSIERLVTILQKMSDYYYGEARPLVEDDVYDVMLDVLRERDPNNAFFFQTGVEKTTDKDVELPYPMPSLNKIKPGEKSLERWFKNYTGPYMVMDKLDGISIQVYKKDDGEVDLFTKKQTGMGTSKLHLLKYLVDKKVLNKLPKGTSVRGELVISQQDFKKLEDLNLGLKNPRSAMSGLVNTDKLDTRIAEMAQFITYGILYPRYSIEEQLDKLKKWGFKTVWNERLEYDDLIEGAEDDDDNENSIKTIEEKLMNILSERREVSDFLIDGLVLTDNSKEYEHTDEDPKYSMAFKMNSTTNMKDATVEEVIWEPTMYGYLQPVIRIQPVELSGNTIVTYVTAHNAKYVQDNKIGKGSVIKIVRSGDVIPYIVSVVKPAKKADMPKMKTEWNESGVEIIVVDPSEDVKAKIKIKQNLHFFRKIGVKFLSEATVTKLYEAGYESVSSIVSASSNKDKNPYKISGLGAKMVTKIYDQIDKAFLKIKLPELMSGSLMFGRGLGVRKIREIIKMYPDILSFDDEDDLEEKILQVPGFSNILAKKFATNLAQFKEFLEELRENCSYDLTFKPAKKSVKSIKSDKSDKTSKTDVNMSNEVVVMTGFRSDPITEFIENNGGRISSGVSKNTTLVLYVGDKSSSKLKKAQDLGITIMPREEFEKKYDI